MILVPATPQGTHRACPLALERLSEHLTATEPMVAMEFDAQAERIWQELGRPIKVES